MTNPSMIDADAVALALVADLDESGDLYGGGWSSAVNLPDGRTARLRVRFDGDAGIGRWIDGEDHDDVFGVFAWRGTNPNTGHPAARPAGFDGRAEVLAGDARGDRWAGDVWWQPTGDDTDPAATVAQVRAWMRGDWFHVGLVVEVCDPGADPGEASLWAVEWDFPGQRDADKAEQVAELLREAGIEDASTAAVARWARDPLEAVARRMSEEDPEDQPAPKYHATLAALVAWWRDAVEGAGDWDVYGGPLADAIEFDYTNGLTIHDLLARVNDREVRS